MNSGIFCLYVALVFAILFLSGWGDRYVAESRMSRKSWAVLLLLIGSFSSLTISIQAIPVNLATATILLCSLLYMLVLLTWKQKLKFLLAMLTAASVSFTLMVLVPHDPAFYFIEDVYLYPISGVCAAYLISRKPLLTMAAAVCGVIDAGIVFDNWFTAPLSGVITVGSEDLMELAAVAFLTSYLLNNTVTSVELLIKRVNRAVHKLDGDPS